MPKTYYGMKNFKDGQYLIAVPPINSTGDTYHLLAYIIIGLNFNKDIPQILLTYDTQNIENQVDRSVTFASTLGLGKYFEKEDICKYGNGFRQNIRVAKLTAFVKDNYSKTRLLDQMVSTTLISLCFIDKGWNKTTEILRDGFKKRDLKYFPKAAQDLVDELVTKETQELVKNNNQPIIIMHVRRQSAKNKSTTNDHLNLPDNYVKGLAVFLKQKGFLTWGILADDREENLIPNYDFDYSTYSFASKVLSNDVDYCKQFHLNLLLKAYDFNVKGVIGNTSGTLDIAAFIGHRVYNIHQFGATLSYQDYRLTMQLTFLSAEDLSNTKELFRKAVKEGQEKLLEAKIKKVLPNLNKWLINEKPVKPSIEYTVKNINIRKSGFKNMFLFKNHKVKDAEEQFVSNDAKDLSDDVTETLKGTKSNLHAKHP